MEAITVIIEVFSCDFIPHCEFAFRGSIGIFSLEAKINEVDYLLPEYASDQRKR